jgi:hypothetical protein
MRGTHISLPGNVTTSARSREQTPPLLKDESIFRHNSSAKKNKPTKDPYHAYYTTQNTGRSKNNSSQL